MKKRLAAILIIILALALAAAAACTVNGVRKEDDGDGIEMYVNIKRDAGGYSGHEVYYAVYGPYGQDYADVLTRLYVDDVYLFTAPNASYTSIIPTEDGNYMLLSDAYSQGLVSHDDLVALAAEAEYDTLDTGTSGGFHGV